MKLQRLLMILFYLMKRQQASTRELVDYLEVSKRTVYRDLDELRTAGASIISTPGAGGGHSLEPGFTLDKLLFSGKELGTMLLGSRALGQFDKTEFSEQARALAGKLDGLHNGDGAEPSKVLLDMQYAFHDAQYHEKLAMAERAVNGNEMVYVRYDSPLCQRMSTSGYVEAYGLVNKVGYWYLAGYCHELQTFRAFNIASISQLLLTGKPFKPDPAFRLNDFWKTLKTK